MIKVHTINILPNNSIYVIGSLMTTRNVFYEDPCRIRICHRRVEDSCLIITTSQPSISLIQNERLSLNPTVLIRCLSIHLPLIELKILGHISLNQT